MLGLPRGGVVVAAGIARSLGLELDALIVRKLGVPDQPELAFGALALADGEVEVMLDRRIVRSAGVSAGQIEAVREAELAEAYRREALYRAGRPALDLAGRWAAVVDDGIATGLTLRAALAAARRLGATRVVAAAPVGPPRCRDELADLADEVVVPFTPIGFVAVGQFYDAFPAVDDGEVCRLLSSGVA